VSDQGFIDTCRSNRKQLPYVPDAVVSFFEAIERNPASDFRNAYDYHLEWVGLDPERIPVSEKLPLYTVRPEERKAAEKVLSRSSGRPKMRIGVQMHASSLPRTWDKMDKLIRALCRKYPEAMIYSFGDPHAAILEPAQWEREANYMPLCGQSHGNGRLWAAMIGAMDLLVGVDSGALHLAGALGVPIVGIFSTVPAWTRIKYYQDAVGIDSRYKCAPCFRIGMTCGMSTPTPGQDFVPSMDLRGKNHAYPCLASIGVDEVMAAVEGRIS
jgi:ADP-heptose:LPS heptosyltransferase